MNLIDAIQNYEYAQNMMQDAKEKIEELMKNGYKSTQEEFDYFYWETDLKTILITPGVTRKDSEMKPTPQYVECVCIDCETNVLRQVSSRSKKEELKRNNKVVCEVCKNERDVRIESYTKQEYRIFENKKIEVEKLKAMPYKEYLQTDHWKKKRLQALKRYNFRCQTCNSNNKLHVHHRTYERRGEELITDLICLCDKCHSKFHDKHDV